MVDDKNVRCDDCGATVPAVDGPTHRYLGATAGCWALYGRLLAGEPSIAPAEFAASVVDAYAAQHPGADVPPARQSVAIHLVALHARLAHGRDVGDLNRIRVDAAEWGHRNGFEWLTPKPDHWPATVVDLASSGDSERQACVERYVRGVYEGWYEAFGPVIERWHREVVRR